MESELRTALTRQELFLAYQPIVRTTDGRLVGMEALLRWTHPVNGPVPAPTAVALAERYRFLSFGDAMVVSRARRSPCQARRAR